ncbi:MAG: 4Fe-4S binding protein [Bacteroidales bacterium]
MDKEKCISCCACIKNCPENARSIKESQVKEAAIRLNSLFREPKFPEIFY